MSLTVGAGGAGGVPAGVARAGVVVDLTVGAGGAAIAWVVVVVGVFGILAVDDGAGARDGMSTSL